MIYVLFMCLCDMSVVLIEARRGYHNFWTGVICGDMQPNMGAGNWIQFPCKKKQQVFLTAVLYLHAPFLYIFKTIQT